MAQTNDPNQTIDQSQTPAPGAVSLDELDSMILSAAPDFASELQDVRSMEVDGSVDLDVVDLGESLEAPEQKNPWREASGFRKFLVFILPFLPKFWDIKHILNKKFAHGGLEQMLLHLGPQILQGTKKAAASTGAYSKERIGAFGKLNWKMKLVAVALLLASFATGAFIYRSYTHGVLPEGQELIMASMEEWASQSYKYDSESEMDSFYDSPRTIQNIMSLPKMIVNIRPSQSSGPNPMAAMEFFLEGLSPEANVEVKDRESEIRDLFQRLMEDMTFDELDSAEGKKLLTEKMRQNLNNILSNGKIRRVYIKEAVVKP